MIDEKELVLHANNICRMDQAEFGSLLDWIPVLCDDEENMVCICLNPQSPYYKQISLQQSTDDHGRVSYSTLNEGVTIDIHSEKTLASFIEHTY